MISKIIKQNNDMSTQINSLKDTVNKAVSKHYVDKQTSYHLKNESHRFGAGSNLFLNFVIFLEKKIFKADSMSVATNSNIEAKVWCLMFVFILT